MIKTIPLYDEVESGKDISSDTLLQYVIDRLDSLEKNLNIKMRSMSNQFSGQNEVQEFSIIFTQDKKFTREEREEILEVFMRHNIRKFRTQEMGNIYGVRFDFHGKDSKSMLDDIENFVNMKEKLNYLIIK